MRLLVALLLAAGSFLTTAQHAEAVTSCATSTESGASTPQAVGASAPSAMVDAPAFVDAPALGDPASGAAVLVRLPGEIRWGCLYWRFADHERFLRNCT